jgi:hypothetical protein
MQGVPAAGLVLRPRVRIISRRYRAPRTSATVAGVVLMADSIIDSIRFWPKRGRPKRTL